ncbi:unnamed protein product [Vicia faba]|uniref:Fatty acid hydroxylase domain-containing protein n=1 Tax=Vicia faba TaxID=3906 RepID=A0AAV0YRR5_VICFA|nr:unnamed protein product [Vicia faba]
MGGPLSTWPWENFGIFKYVLYGPFVGRVLYEMFYEKELKFSWCLCLLILSALRGFVYLLWNSYSSMLFLTRNRQILKQGIDFKQLDKEWDWDNFLILEAMLCCVAYYMFPFLQNLPSWNIKGVIAALIFHVGISEPLYYWVHRKFHGNYLFTNYHSLHHSSPVPQSLTADVWAIATLKLFHIVSLKLSHLSDISYTPQHITIYTILKKTRISASSCLSLTH